MKSRLLRAVCACMLLYTATPAVGSIVYEYTGNPFDVFSSPPSYTTDMAVTGTIELPTPLDPNMILGAETIIPISFSFSDGIQTLTDQNFTSGLFQFGTDGDGNITDWVVKISSDDPFFTQGDQLRTIETVAVSSDPIATRDLGLSVECVDPQCAVVINDGAEVGGNPGSWSIVPIPAAVWLFASGLIGLVGISRKKRLN